MSPQTERVAAGETAADVMTPDVLTIADTMTTDEAAEFLLEHEISGAPVVNREGSLVGVVSFTDLARATVETGQVSGETPGSEWFARARYDEIETLRGWEGSYDAEDISELHVEWAGGAVADVMTPAVYRVTEETPVAEIARTMVTGHLHRVLVVRDDRLVGIVTSMDLLGLLAEEE